jgi:hypothetical protein
MPFKNKNNPFVKQKKEKNSNEKKAKMASPSQVIRFITLLSETNVKLKYTRMKRKHVIQPIRNAIDYFSIINEDDTEEVKQKYYFTVDQLEHLRAGIDKLWTYVDDVIDEPREQEEIDQDVVGQITQKK